MPRPAHPLRLLHESEVLAEEIDALGHMNVRFYAARALASTDRLLAELGLEASDLGATGPLAYDLPRLFTRYQREQHTGSPLVVMGGLIDVDSTGLRFYHELRNPERDELAASFVHDLRLRGSGKAGALMLSDALVKKLAEAQVAFPEAGRPRTVDLDAEPVAPTYREALKEGLAFRMPRTIDQSDCDAAGRLSPETRPFYMWGGDVIPPATPQEGPMLIDLPDGGKMGWASIESRSVMIDQPMAGMQVQSFAATVRLAHKTHMRRYWVFDVATERLLLSNEVVELALHLGARRAIEIPELIRKEMQVSLRPDLA